MSQLALAGGLPVRTAPFAKWPIFGDDERRALLDVLESGEWGGYHPSVKQFEAAFAAFHQAPFAAVAANGTVTLEAALHAAGVGAGDEVIVPPITFVATAAAVLRVGAIPVFADVDAALNLSPEAVRAAITPKTRALMVVHFAGRPADMDALLEIARQHQLTVIEDAAHAHGAQWRGRHVGTLGDIASFSFQHSKNLTAGEGGILIGNREDLIEGARSIFNQGRIPGGAWYQHENLGTNNRLTGWQAAVLLCQLARLPEQLERRARNAEWLNRELAALDFLEPLPADPRVTLHSYYLYVLRLRLDRLPGVTRDAFTAALAAEGIPGISSYPRPLYANNVFRKYECRITPCPEAERSCRDAFWVSHNVMLAETDELKDLVAALKKVAAHAGELAARV